MGCEGNYGEGWRKEGLVATRPLCDGYFFSFCSGVHARVALVLIGVMRAAFVSAESEHSMVTIHQLQFAKFAMISVQ